MRSLFFTIMLGAFVTLTSADTEKGLIVTSSAFSHGGAIPQKYTCEGENINPPVSVANIPANTKMLAITVHDPDADTPGGFTHWVVWNIMTDNIVTENYKGAKQGYHSGGKSGYIGMCPPKDMHHYYFKVYAVDTKITLAPTADKAMLEAAIAGHVLAQGELMGTYQKQKK